MHRQSRDGMTARLPHRSLSTRVNECKLYFMLGFTDHRWLRRVYRSIRWKLMMLAIIFSGFTFLTQNTRALLSFTINRDRVGNLWLRFVIVSIGSGRGATRWRDVLNNWMVLYFKKTKCNKTWVKNVSVTQWPAPGNLSTGVVGHTPLTPLNSQARSATVTLSPAFGSLDKSWFERSGWRQL